MNTIYWTTDEQLSDNTCVMDDYLYYHNMLDITYLDGTYAEGVNCRGDKYEIHASGDGDFFKHKVEFKLIED